MQRLAYYKNLDDSVMIKLKENVAVSFLGYAVSAWYHQ